MSFFIQLLCLLLACASACAHARLNYRWVVGTGWAKTNETRYVYDGRLPIQERDETNGVRVSYVRGIDLSGSLQGAGGIGGLLARQDHSTFNPQPSTTFYHSDGAGNITALTDSSGAVVARYLYDPFGKLLGRWGSMAEANRYQFSSKETDRLTGLSYYGYRFYDPSLQRWLNQDPLGEGGGINLYGFVGNSPLNAIDPWGEEITYFEGDNSFGYPSGTTPYLGGDTVFENLVAGAYNAIPLVNNIIEQGFKPLHMLGEAVAEAAGDQFGSQVEDGTRNLMAVLPFLLSKKCPEEAIRIRHYTNTKGLKGIEESGLIRASDQNRVFAEPARRKPLSQVEAQNTYGLKPGRGRNFVETDVPKSQVSQRFNPDTGANELVIRGDVPLQNPTFTERP